MKPTVTRLTDKRGIGFGWIVQYPSERTFLFTHEHDDVPRDYEAKFKQLDRIDWELFLFDEYGIRGARMEDLHHTQIIECRVRLQSLLWQMEELP